MGDGGARLTELPAAPPPGPGELRVVMRLAPVNPADVLLIAGRYSAAEPAAGPIGAEGVGVVEDVGEGVEGILPGDRIICLDRGNWVEARTIPAERAVLVPGTLGDEAAAVLRINPATALRLLVRAGVTRGNWLIHDGASSMVGRAIVALATRAGIRTVSVVRDEQAARRILKPLGGNVVIAAGPGLAERMLSLTDGERPRAALDCVAGASSGELAECLDHGARLIVYGHLSGEPCSIPSGVLTSRGLCVEGFSLRVDEAGAGRQALQPRYDSLAQLLVDEPAILPAVARYPLAAFATALIHRGDSRALLALAEGAQASPMRIMSRAD